MKIDIIDIGFGNIKSIKNCIEKTNIRCNLISEVDNLKSDILILPGVGSAGPYMKKLKDNNFDEAIIEYVKKGGRIIGICLGFQILCNRTEEDGGVLGLGLINGEVEKLKMINSNNGWKKFYFNKNKIQNKYFRSQAKLTKKFIIDGRVFYNHEYGVKSYDSSSISIPISKELNIYSGFYLKKNILGIQFHPEKSQNTGLELIKMIL